MFGQVLDKLDAWFGRAFLLSRYFPSLLCATVNLALAYAAFPAARAAINGLLDAPVADKAVDLLIMLAVVATFAYAIAPFTQATTLLLEGAYLPRWIAQILVVAEVRRQQALAAREGRLFQDRAALPSPDDVLRQLARVRELGARHQRIADPGAIRRAEARVLAIREKCDLRTPIGSGELLAAIAAVADALRGNCAEMGQLRRPVRVGDPPMRDTDFQDCEALSELHTEFTARLVPYARAIAEEREAGATERARGLFARGELAPTRLGNDAAALRAYCRDRYGIEFDFFWPRFLLAVQEKAKLSAAISGAKIQLDFTVLSLAFAACSTVAWLVLLGAVGDDVRLIAGVAVIGPLATWFWLRAVYASHAEFATVVSGAIDVARFDVLQALRLPLPPTTELEKRLWERVARLGLLDDHTVDVTLRHPSA